MKRQTSTGRLHMGCGEALNPKYLIPRVRRAGNGERRAGRTIHKPVKGKR